MTDHKSLIAEARSWAEVPYVLMSDQPAVQELLGGLADALEAATVERAVVEAQALEQFADQIEAGLDEWEASGNDEYLVNEILDPLVKRVRARAVEIREGRQ